MGAGFKFDNKALERDVKRAAEGAVGGVAQRYQRMLDSLGRRFKGRPVEEIKPVLKREWSRIGGSISDPELTQYASHISNGIRIQMRVKM